MEQLMAGVIIGLLLMLALQPRSTAINNIFVGREYDERGGVGGCLPLLLLGAILFVILLLVNA